MGITPIYKLYEILEQVNQLSEDLIMWLKGDYPFYLDMECILSDEYGDLTTGGDKLINYPDFSHEFALSILKEIYTHLSFRNKSLSTEDLLKAFNYYYENDAL